ncbi:hypothetical protein QOZ80_2BG0179360 [Eleusine coracana subsp. coracana]|nr:hypothetical protein QOZ80_2BG0179360 [Eleusine coracana subsp. coracana]
MPWVARPPVQLVFLYQLPNITEQDLFPLLVKQLKDSLAAAPALYLPLAGRLAYVAETRDVVLDWTEQVGVAFVEAEAGHVPALLGLVPELDAAGAPGARAGHSAPRRRWRGARRLRAPRRRRRPRALAIRGRLGARHSPRLGCVGQVDSPAVLWQGGHRYRPPTRRPAGARAAQQVRTQFTRGQGNGVRHPALPDGAPHVLPQRPTRSVANTSHRQPRFKPVSTYVALPALGWTAFVRSKNLAAPRLHGRPARAPGPARGRGLPGQLPPPVRGDLLAGEEACLLFAARAVQAAVREVVAAPPAGADAWVDRVSGLANVASSPHYRV